MIARDDGKPRTAPCPECGRAVTVDVRLGPARTEVAVLCNHGPGPRGEFLCPGGGSAVRS